MDRKTLAKLANVSYSTVNKALQNSSEISLETRQRIQALAKEHHFVSNATVRRPHREHTDCIAMIFSRRMFYDNRYVINCMNIQQNLVYEMERFNYTYVLNVSHDAEGESMVQRIYQQKIVDGFIFVADDITTEEIAFLEAHQVPYVFMGIAPALYTDTTPFFLSDERHNGELATQYLIDQGFQNIVTITNNAHEFSTYTQRTQGYIARMEAANLLPRVLHHSMATSDTASIIAQYLPDLLQAEAAYVQWDGVAGVLMQLLRERNVCVPKNLSVIGHNDFNITGYFRPFLTTVRDARTEQSRGAIAYLINKIHNPDCPIVQRRIAGTLIERESVKRKPLA